MKKQSGEGEGCQYMRSTLGAHAGGAHVRASLIVRGAYVFLEGPCLAAGHAPDRTRACPKAVRGASVRAPPSPPET
jgi:hypothetical protein